jgi:hypothetical protein
MLPPAPPPEPTFLPVFAIPFAPFASIYVSLRIKLFVVDIQIIPPPDPPRFLFRTPLAPPDPSYFANPISE